MKATRKILGGQAHNNEGRKLISFYISENRRYSAACPQIIET